MRSRTRGWLVLALFFCSGATALVYEVIWSKFLSQMFGSTIHAQTVVLAVFMGGLALGNRIFGRWADGMSRPVQAYGFLEIAIGFYAFLYPTLNGLADLVFVRVGSGIAGNSALLLALKGTLSMGLLLGPTILMGGTLPLLAAWLQKSSSDAGRRSARFYSVNSLGAVTGAAVAGFWLVQNLGMIGSVQVTAVLNILIGCVAILVSRDEFSEPADAPAAATVSAAGTTSAISDRTLRWAGLIVASTGAVSMGLEVLASRSLALIFGSSLQSFATVLMAFILGIGLGSAWIASPGRRIFSAERFAVALLCLASVWVVVLVFHIERWSDFYRLARIGLSRTEIGYVYHQGLATGIALVVLGVPAACIGAVLPLMIRALAREGVPLGARVGVLLTWNTLGAVGGVLVTGFVLMPQAGLRNAFGALALALAIAATLIAWSRRWNAGIAAAGTAGVLAFGLFFVGGEDWRHVMSYGVFRARETEFDRSMMPVRKQHTKILFYEDAPDATVSVEEGDGIGAPVSRVLRINGKPDASSGLDLTTQLLVAHLPMLARPGATDVFVLGLGSGVTAGALLPYPVREVVVAENCAPVIRSSKFFEKWNRGVLDDPRTRLRTEDARTVLKLSPQRYDVIIAEPSNPWAVGIGSVFSVEFYELAASRLKPGGIVVQWFHVYEMQDEIVDLVLRTFSSVFPNMEIWDAGIGDIIMLGALQPWPDGPDVYRSGFDIEAVRSDFAGMGIRSPAALLARQLASQRTAFAIASDGPLQSDLFPVLEYAAPKAFYIGATARMLERFDERTWQQRLASPEKLGALRAMTMEEARGVFSTVASINFELYARVRGPSATPEIPCAFGGGALPPAPGSQPGADPVRALLYQAVQALGAGDRQQALALAAQALGIAPFDLEAAYLARIIDRELKQGGVPSASR